jgi:hypothetical protein
MDQFEIEAREQNHEATSNVSSFRSVAADQDKTLETHPQVCFIGQSSGLHLPKDKEKSQIKDSYLKRINVLRNVSLYSWNLALLSNTHGPKPHIRCKVQDWGSTFETFDDVKKYMGHFDNIQVDFEDDVALIKKQLIKNSEKCDWLVVTRLDADDAITPGYWNYVQDLIHRGRFNGAGAGMVGTKLIPAVETTPNKCRAMIEGERTAVKSQGITAVYRWDIFRKLNYPFVLGPHALELGKLRENYRRKIQGVEVNITENAPRERDDLFNVTRVKYVDSMVEEWGPPALWIRTTLSSHFPWIEWNAVPTGCSLSQWKEIIQREGKRKFKDDFLAHLYNNRNIGHLTLMEACKSNDYFLRFQYVRMKIPNKTQATSCEEFVDRYGEKIIV